ncbi:hypothetical protein WS67_07400 [Burkholderia singularis]|uniref:Uncharacterized protein n=1 Tax=Burkholderia singularis TaxID=1503053 RepID=A0A118DPZ1_9BURK|nr:hypothetical protein WS67_07400 [Burkholderia singularis]
MLARTTTLRRVLRQGGKRSRAVPGRFALVNFRTRRRGSCDLEKTHMRRCVRYVRYMAVCAPHRRIRLLDCGFSCEAARRGIR